ncbi:hypothetical protein VNO80_19013 [Phaseolus coccineus]|uniref:Uncharacterized protein n=1 Tax=Phaseolus coccineus TaxID=3886 RepID=A0AAN9MK42_PHACN
MNRFSPSSSTFVIPIVFTTCLAFSRACSIIRSTSPKLRLHQQRQLPQCRDEEVEARKSAIFKSSVDIQSEWNMHDQIPFSMFSKLSFTILEPENLLLCGALEYYDRPYDRITPKNERRLERFKNRNFFKVTTTDDPVISRLPKEDKATVKEKWNRLPAIEQARLKAR